MKKQVLITSALLLALPLVASAQTLQPIVNLIESVGRIVALLIPILIGIAVVVFFWGLVKYIREPGEGHAEGKSIMIAGLVSLFVMVSLWGILYFAGGALGIYQNSGQQLQPPHIQGVN